MSNKQKASKEKLFLAISKNSDLDFVNYNKWQNKGAPQAATFTDKHVEGVNMHL